MTLGTHDRSTAKANTHTEGGIAAAATSTIRLMAGQRPEWPHGPAQGPNDVPGREAWLLYVSLALLLLSTIPGADPIVGGVTLAWLASVAVLTVFNVGAAFGAYVASVALFANLSGSGWGSVFDRPDNYALLILVAGLAVRIAAARPSIPWNWSTIVIVGFVGYGLLQTAWVGSLTRSTFAWYMRTFGLPMLMFLLLAQYGPSLREVRTLVRALLILGAYTALVAVAERIGWEQFVLPPWIAGDTLDSRNSDPASLAYPGRSGGLLLQPAWNGLALSLIYCIAMLSNRWSSRRNAWLAGVVGTLCLVGVFFSYTRAAWLACGVASLVLLLKPSATRARTRFKRFGMVAMSATLVLALAVLPDTLARQRIRDSDTVVFRLNLWKAAFSMVADRPVVGAGFGSFGGNIAEYQQAMTVGGQTSISATPVHNTLLGVLVELGTIGLLLYVAALVAIIRRAGSAARAYWGRDGAVWVAVFAGVYVLQALFAFAHEPTTNQILFGTMGVIAGLLRWGPPRVSAVRSEDSLSSPR